MTDNGLREALLREAETNDWAFMAYLTIFLTTEQRQRFYVAARALDGVMGGPTTC